MLHFRPLRSLVASLALAGVTAVSAQDLGNGWSPSILEISQMPEYCQKQFLSKHDAAVLNNLFPGCGGYMNHFCPGLILINRAANPSIARLERGRIARQARNEISYTTQRLPPTCSIGGDIAAADARLRMLEMTLK